MVKYLFKYISKGIDRIRAVIHNYGAAIHDSENYFKNVVDEIKIEGNNYATIMCGERKP